MNRRILLTGGAGFIGRRVAQIMTSEKVNYTAIVRPNSDEKRLQHLTGAAELIQLDLSDIEGLKNYLANQKFDVIIHIGALRGGRKFSEKAYYDTNVVATEQLAINALQNDSHLVFCSSVGVYGAIPNELPANVMTSFNKDNYYHYTKIHAEKIIAKYMLHGLKADILRPAVTYGVEDYGFPYTLTKLVHRKLMLLPKETVWINLANIEMVAEAFWRVANREYTGGSVYNLADKEPVKLNELVDFISERVHGKKYPSNRYINRNIFAMGEKLAEKLHQENLHNRIRLISRSWFYDTSDLYRELSLKGGETIPDFGVVVDWYKRLKGVK